MRGSSRRPAALGAAAATYVDIGSEPALAVGPRRRVGEPASRAISVRWLSGTVLTGFTSFFLMGGALLAALNGQELLITPAQQADLAAMAAGPTDGQKGDRYIPPPPAPTAREVVQVSTITRQDDRDIIQQRPFVRINAPLTVANTAGVDVPAYDPLAIIGENNEAPVAVAEVPLTGDRIYAAEVDGQVVIETGVFPLGAEFADATPIATADVEMIVRQTANALAGGGVQLAALAFAPEPGAETTAAEDPFAALGARMRAIPENVTFVTRSIGGASRDERVLAIGDGQTVGGVLESTGMGEAAVTEAVAALESLVDLSALTPGHRIRIAFAPSAGVEAAPVPIRISIYADGAHQATIARNDLGVFVRADEPPELQGIVEGDATVVATTGTTPRLYEAMYLTAMQQEIPAPLINQLIRIFAFDLDMQSRVGPGDSIEVFHAMPTDADPDAAEGILYAAVTLDGVTKRYYQFRTPDDGIVDYYDEEGRSASIFLIRKPISVGEMRSGYGMRIHPILGTRTLHAGVDWAAPAGTPIVAAGDGVVVSAGWSSSYGNYTRIQHANGYESAYAHQTRIAPGIEPGATVRQGQVIGFVGSTGLSTGPHLHYEIRINGQTVDPLRIRLPRGRDLEGDMLAQFESQRAELDALLGIAPDPTQTAAAR
ncbi:MAG: M23 family metallopeptidase [Bauldia sp.]